MDFPEYNTFEILKPYVTGEFKLDMDCSSNACPKVALSEQVIAPERVLKAAESLACFLIDTSEFQEFLRLGRLVKMDREVNEILGLLDDCDDVGSSMGDSISELEERLVSLPLVKEYRRAEQSVREIVNAVDQVISESAGLPFALNAQPAGCG